MISHLPYIGKFSQLSVTMKITRTKCFQQQNKNSNKITVH